MKKDLIDLATAKAKLVAVAIAALAVGGTAATVGGISFTPVDSSTDVTASASPTATESPDAEGSEDADGDEKVEGTETTPESTEAASPDASESAVVCPDGLKNHGAYVSTVAKDKTLTGREHGKAVSAAAKSDCGKAAKADGTEDAEAAEDAEDTADTEDTADAADADDADEADDDNEPAKTAKAQHGHGNGHGKKHRG